MRRALLVVLTLTFAASCGVTVDDYRKAAPSSQGVDLKGPAASKKSEKLSGDSTRQELVGDPALMPGVTALTTFLVNGSVVLTLGTIAAIIKEEPAEITSEKAVWGPLTQPLWADEFRFTMTQKSGVYSYVLEGRAKETKGDFVTVLTGQHTPELGGGVGGFVVDFSSGQKLARANKATGRAEVAYTRDAKKNVTLKIAFREIGTVGSKGQDSDYSFAQANEGDGEFEFVVANNFITKGAAAETLSVKSRWHFDGVGRSDVVVKDGDAKEPIQFTECWDSSLNRTYYGDTVKLFPTEGEEKSCGFTTASYSTLSI